MKRPSAGGMRLESYSDLLRVMEARVARVIASLLIRGGFSRLGLLRLGDERDARDELVALSHLDGDDPVRPERGVVGGELGLLDDAVLRRKHEILGLLEVARLDHGPDLLALGERQQVDDRATLRLARPERKLVHLQAVDLTDGGEEEQVVVGGGDEEVLDVVVLLEVHAHHALTAAPLLAVGRYW